MTAVLRPRTRTLLSAFLFVVCYLFFVISVAAQAAALTGRVVDPDGRSVANAEIFVSGATAAPLRARADAGGKFTVTNLEPGRYAVVATAPGLVSDAHSVDLTTAPATLDIALHLSALDETLVVSAAQIDQRGVVARVVCDRRLRESRSDEQRARLVQRLGLDQLDRTRDVLEEERRHRAGVGHQPERREIARHPWMRRRRRFDAGRVREDGGGHQGGGGRPCERGRPDGRHSDRDRADAQSLSVYN